MNQYPSTQAPLTPGAAPADRNGSPVKADNIRTYRGRRLEDLIPQIRAELGHDAIILRERQGVTGGIGGFFAQRCVEVDAQPAPRVNLYADDDSDAEFADIDVTAAIAKMTAGAPTPAAAPVAETVPAYVPAQAVEPEPVAELAPTPVYEPTPAREPEPEPAAEIARARVYEPTPAPEPEPVAELAPARMYEPTPAPDPEPVAELAPARVYEPTPVPEHEPVAELAPDPEPEPAAETSFAASLEQAAITVEAEPTIETVTPEPVMETVMETITPEPVAETIEPEPVMETVTPEPVLEVIAPEPVAETIEPEPVMETVTPEPMMETIEPEPVIETYIWPTATKPVEPEPVTEAYISETYTPEPVAETHTPEPVIETYTPEPVIEAIIPDLVAELVPAPAAEVVEPEPVMDTIEPEPVMDTIEPEPVAATIPADWSFIAFDELTSVEPVVSDHELIADAIGTAGVTTWTNEIVHGESASALEEGIAAASETTEEPSAGLDPEVEARITELEEHLLDTGFSTGRTAELIATATENLDSTSDRGAFEDALHAAVASALPAPRSLPVGAIAVVGAGGSGKTRCVAALASAHARVVVVPVNVAKLGESGSDLAGLLRGEAVTVLGSGSSDELGEAIGTARNGGLVIIDTEAVAPNDTEAMNTLARSLSDLELDGIYLAVPATLSPRAAAKLAQGFSTLAPTGLIATHVDEGDQLGMVAELAMSTGTPIGYAHAGTDLQTAILSTHREQLAARLLA